MDLAPCQVRVRAMLRVKNRKNRVLKTSLRVMWILGLGHNATRRLVRYKRMPNPDPDFGP